MNYWVVNQIYGILFWSLSSSSNILIFLAQLKIIGHALLWVEICKCIEDGKGFHDYEMRIYQDVIEVKILSHTIQRGASNKVVVL